MKLGGGDLSLRTETLRFLMEVSGEDASLGLGTGTTFTLRKSWVMVSRDCFSLLSSGGGEGRDWRKLFKGCLLVACLGETSTLGIDLVL